MQTEQTKVSQALRALLTGAIDYAGLFPPCTLSLDEALRNQASYVVSNEKWMLATFVLSVEQFEAVSVHLPAFSGEAPLEISALGPKSTDNFAATLKDIAEKIRKFNSVEEPSAVVRQLEMALPTQVTGETFANGRDVLGDLSLRCFWEAPADDATKVIAQLAQQNSGFGFKLRTGGVKADAFPSSQQIARALVAAAQKRMPIKFTAGLHHPIRMFRDEVNTKMHGFLNVLGAGVLALEHNWDEGEVIEMLEDEDAANFEFDGNVFSWRGATITADRIEQHRRIVTSFGSCSFDEPREDLRALHLL